MAAQVLYIKVKSQQFQQMLTQVTSEESWDGQTNIVHSKLEWNLEQIENKGTVVLAPDSTASFVSSVNKGLFQGHPSSSFIFSSFCFSEESSLTGGSVSVFSNVSFSGSVSEADIVFHANTTISESLILRKCSIRTDDVIVSTVKSITVRESLLAVGSFTALCAEPFVFEPSSVLYFDSCRADLS